jgi:hypothetical protein
MSKLFEDPYYSCPKCGGRRFVTCTAYAVMKDPEPFNREALESQPPTLTHPVYRLKCDSCGEPLDRYGITTGKIKPFNNSMTVPEGLSPDFAIRPDNETQIETIKGNSGEDKNE